MIASLRAQILAAIALSACTSEVVVEQEAETTTTTTETTPTTVPPTFSCNEPIYPGAERRHACLPPGPGGCPSAADAMPALSELLSEECPSSEPEFCGCWESPADVPCGPDPTQSSQCCYYVDMVREEVCEGRPFVVDGRARVAPMQRRDDWRARRAPDLSGLDAAARQALADAWARDGAFEHASVASFARFILELVAVGAPADLVRDAQAALGDEIRHAELCFGMASAYRGEPVGPGAMPVAGAPIRSDVVSVAVATAVEGCINETLATLIAHASAAEATDPAARATLTEIAGDESRHASLAWRFVAWACRRDPAARRAVTEVLAQAAPALDDPAWPAGADADQMRAHGHLDPAARRALVAEGLDGVIRPAVRSLLSALDACPIHA